MLAVEVHQHATTSTDLHFELGVAAVRTPVSYVAGLDQESLDRARDVAASLLPASLAEEWMGHTLVR